ncbi:MAG: ATP synthase F0 subunit B [Thermodesulfobacteriota bacterium]
MNLIFIIVISAIFAVLYIIIPPFKQLEGLLEINNTVLLQFPIFLIALYILNKLIFQPLLQVWDRRDSLTKGTVKEARELTAQVEKIIEDYDIKLNEARNEAAEARNELRREGQQEAEKMISAARNDSQNQIEKHREKLESELKEMRTKIKPEIELLAKNISSRILGREA